MDGPALPAPEEVQVVLWDGVELLDFAGPAQVFASVDDGRAFRVRPVAARPGPVRVHGFVTVVPDGVLGSGPIPRILVVPGGASESAAADVELVEAIGRVGSEVEILFSVCTGALVAASAGLLRAGMAATTWHGAIDRLRDAAPEVRVVSGPRWIDNGRVVTAAGVSAGIDAAFHLVEKLCGRDAMVGASRHMEYTLGGFDEENWS